ERYKARFVAKGYSQAYGLDYDETFSPVFKLTSLRILLAIGATYDLEIKQMDVKTAFLNSDIDTELYVEQSKGYKRKDNESDKELVCKLKKELYGIKQAACLWNRRINKYFQDNDFKKCEADPCIYTGYYDNRGIVLIGIWVDDIIIVGTRKKVKEVKETL